jgi:hypothetical protein
MPSAKPLWGTTNKCHTLGFHLGKSWLRTRRSPPKMQSTCAATPSRQGRCRKSPNTGHTGRTCAASLHHNQYTLLPLQTSDRSHHNFLHLPHYYEICILTLLDRLQRLGYGELCAKALHWPRSMPTMSMSLDVAPFVGGIIQDLLHLPRCFEPQILQVKTRALAFAKVGIGSVIVISPLGAMPWRYGTPLGKVRHALLGSCFVGQAGRGLRTGVDVGAMTFQISRILSAITSCLGGSVVGSCGARPPVRCVAFGVFRFPASVRGLRTGVDVKKAAPDLSALSVVPSCLSRSVVGSCGGQSQGWCVVFGLFSFCLFPL